MWDVKTFIIEFTIIPAVEFYLNYVGCKEIRQTVTSNGYIGFTLTMWDVKSSNNIRVKRRKI